MARFKRKVSSGGRSHTSCCRLPSTRAMRRLKSRPPVQGTNPATSTRPVGGYISPVSISRVVGLAAPLGPRALMPGIVRRGLSISVKLPLLIAALVVAVTLSYGWAAYQTVRRSTATAVASRLGTVVDQLAATLKAARGQLLATARTVADSPAVRAYALAPEI